MKATNKKMGRPVAEKPKIVEIRTRIDEETSKKVDCYCSEKNITRSDFLRMGIELVFSKKEK